MSIKLNRDQSDQVQNPDADVSEQLVERIHFNIDFEVSHPSLDKELPNLGIIINRLESHLDEVFHGYTSQGIVMFRITDSDLSMDDWIEDGNYDVKVEVSPEELEGDEESPNRTEIEFYPDHIKLHPPYHEMDGEVIDRLKLLLEKYYLLGEHSDTVVERLSNDRT